MLTILKTDRYEVLADYDVSHAVVRRKRDGAEVFMQGGEGLSFINAADTAPASMDAGKWDSYLSEFDTTMDDAKVLAEMREALEFTK